MKIIIALLAGLFLVASCDDPNSKVVARNIKEIEGTVHNTLPIKWDIGTQGGTWQDSFSEDPKSYNPFSNIDGSYITVMGNMLEGFFDYEPSTREWKGLLFDSFKIDANEEKDTLSLTAHIRDAMKWSDGIDLTSDDLLYWYNELDGDKEIYPRGYEGQYLTMDDGSKKRIEMEKIDQKTIKWVFPRVVANPVLSVNASTLVPKHIWEPVKISGGAKAVADFWGIDTSPDKLVGNGAFLLESYTPGERLIFKRNSNYWQKDEAGNQLPYIEKIVATYVADPNAELLKFQNGELEAYGLRGKDLATLLPETKTKGYLIWNGGAAGAYPAVIFNENPAKIAPEKLKLFTDKRFRHAISSVIDRETIISQIINGLAEPQYHIISEYNKYYNPSFATTFKYDLAKAKSILSEIGLKDANGDGLLEFETGKPLEFDILTGSPDTLVHQIINIMIDDLKKVGIKANLQVVDPQVYSQKIISTYDWDCAFSSFSFPTFTEQWYNVWPSTGDLHRWNPNQKSPSQSWEKIIDPVYAKLEYTYNPDKVQKLYDEFQKTLMDELVVIPLYRKYTFTAVYDKWGNVNWDSQHNIGDGLVRTYLKK